MIYLLQYNIFKVLLAFVSACDELSRVDFDLPATWMLGFCNSKWIGLFDVSCSHYSAQARQAGI